jgi:hypothetical protein
MGSKGESKSVSIVEGLDLKRVEGAGSDGLLTLQQFTEAMARYDLASAGISQAHLGKVFSAWVTEVCGKEVFCKLKELCNEGAESFVH